MNGTAALVVAIVSVGSPLFAQGTVRTITPGSAFSALRPAMPVEVANVADGRRFRGGAGELILSGSIEIPPSALPKLQKLVVHFRTSEGATLQSVKLQNMGPIVTNVTGDFVTRERLEPKHIANAWVFPLTDVHAPLIVQLSVSFSGGIDSIVDAGEFVLTGVVAEFARKPLAPESRTGGSGGGISSLPRWSSRTFPSPNGGLLVFTIMADGNPACASYNGAGCLWGVPLAQIDLARLQPLVCGEAHRARWGVTGYEDARHWCSLARLP
jgi:hypothetical protein